MFRKFVAELVAARTVAEIENILYREDGVDIMYQREKISWKDHELLFDLAAKLQKGMEK